MADAHECRRQAAECRRLSRTNVTLESETIMSNMARSWVGWPTNWTAWTSVIT